MSRGTARRPASDRPGQLAAGAANRPRKRPSRIGILTVLTTSTQTPALDPALAAAVPGGVLVVDFGAQYSQLIARRIRECRVFSAVVPHDTPPQEIQALKPAGLVLSIVATLLACVATWFGFRGRRLGVRA